MNTLHFAPHVSSFRMLHRLVFLMTLSVGLLWMSASARAQTLSASATDFDTVACGSKSCHKVIFKNNTGASQTLESIAVFGTTFTLEDLSYAPPYVLKAGDSVALLFCYNAGSPSGPAVDTIKLQLTGVGSQQAVALRGHSVAPKMALSQSSVDFGVIIIGTAKQIQLIITNQGDGSLTVPNASGVAPPFYVVQGAGAIIAPGQSDTLSLLYVPTQAQTDVATAVFGNPPCLANVRLDLRGVAVSAPIPTLGGVLQVNPEVVNFDTTLCGQKKKLPLQFLNVGSDTVVIRSVLSPATLPFSASIPLRTLAPSKDTTIEISYEPTVVPSTDSQTVRILADTRQSLSVGMLFDVSGSMTGAISDKDATVRLRAAKDAGKIFLSQLINDPSRHVIDEAQVMSFSSPADSFVVRSAFTTNRGLSAFAIDALVAKGSTCLYESLRRAIDSIKTKPHPVLILLSDGGESGCNVTPTLSDALAAISANNIKVFVVGITDPSNSLSTVLQQIASAGKTTATFAVTQQEITNAFLAISKQLSQNIEVDIPIVGRSVAPLLELSPALLSFDSVKVGEEKCMRLSVRNTGTAAQTLNPTLFTGMDPQFEIRNLPVAALQPGAAAQSFDVCFRPNLLRKQSSSTTLSYNGCRPALQINTQGIGYDSVIVELDTTILLAKIGESVGLPFRLRSLIPKTYAVDSMRLSLSYNSSVLSFDSASRTNTLSSVYSVSTPEHIYSGLRGTSTLQYRGGTLVNSIANSRLGMLNFRVLRGNSLQSDVSLSSLVLADGNPKVGIVQPASVQLDPVCFLGQRLLDPSKRISQTQFVSVQAHSGTSGLQLRYRLSDAGNVRITLFDALGRELAEMQQNQGSAGEKECNLECRSMPEGPLFLHIEANGAGDSMMFMSP